MSLSEFTQSVAGVSTVGIAQSGASPAHGHHQIVDGGLRDVFQFLLESHTELADVLWDCATMSYASIENVPKVLDGRHVGRIWRPVEDIIVRTDEVHADPGNMGASIVVL